MVGKLEEAGARGVRAGKGAPRVAEEFALEQVFRNGGAIDWNKRAIRPETKIVNRPCHKLLAGAAFTSKEDGYIGGCYPLNNFINLFDRGMLAKYGRSRGQHVRFVSVPP